MITKASIERLKNIIDISDVVGSYLTLHKSGADFVAMCPFHDDNHPSLRINSAKGFYHCFACGAGGDAIKFIMEYEKLNYPEAIEKLAKMYNFTLDYDKTYKKKEYNQKILPTLNIYYRSLLYKKEYSFALDYLKSRGLNSAMIEKFGIGYAPSSVMSINYLQNDNVNLDEAVKVGVLKRNERGVYASFIDRITFPINNHLGNIIGFGGRTLKPDNPAKYVNSPQSEIFDKSRVLYGFDLAKEQISRRGEIIICEGYMDCVMLHQAGLDHAVAVLGTALTEHHIPLLKRYNAKVVLSFDSDEAGINAALKSSNLLARNEIDGKVILIKGAKDPAEMVANGLISELKAMYQKGVELGEFWIRQSIINLNPKSPIQKAKALEIIQEFTFALKPIIAASYEPLVAELLDINLNMFKLSKANLNFAKNNNFQKEKTQNRPIILNRKADILELSILKNMLENERFLEKIKEDDFLCHNASEIFANHYEYYQAIMGSKNPNNPKIIALKMNDKLEIYQNEKEFQIAINMLFVSFCDKKIKDLNSSKDEDKTKKIMNWMQMKFKIKGRN